MKNLLSRVQRELPDTDQDRYDVAYERGRAQARSGLLAGGLALGSAVGAAVMWLFEPSRGAGRRAQLASRLQGLKSSVARTTSGRAEDLSNRVHGFAIERGIKEPPPDGDHATRDARGTDYGDRYREGFGRTEADPTRPGSQVPDPLQPAEVAAFGPAGPVAGAASGEEETERRLAGS
jgi:hypothetical protein